MGQMVSVVQVNVSFQIIPCLVGRLGSEVRVSVSFQSFALNVCLTTPVMFFCRFVCRPVPERSVFCPVCPVMF